MAYRGKRGIRREKAVSGAGSATLGDQLGRGSRPTSCHSTPRPPEPPRGTGILTWWVTAVAASDAASLAIAAS